jgi:hypothetical protein
LGARADYRPLWAVVPAPVMEKMTYIGNTVKVELSPRLSV